MQSFKTDLAQAFKEVGESAAELGIHSLDDVDLFKIASILLTRPAAGVALSPEAQSLVQSAPGVVLGAQLIRGEITAKDIKTGDSEKTGKAWKKYSFAINGVWYGSFNKEDIEPGLAVGDQVKAFIKQSKNPAYFDLVKIQKDKDAQPREGSDDSESDDDQSF